MNILAFLITNLIFYPALGSTEASKITCPHQTVSAREGDDVILRVEVHPRVDPLEETVMITRGHDELVHVYQNHQDYLPAQSPQYNNRTTFYPQNLSRGLVNLTISNVTQADSGLYYIYVPGLSDQCVINLTVVNKSRSTEPPGTPLKNTDDAAAKEKSWNTPLFIGLSVLAAGGVVGVIGFLAAELLCRSGKMKIFVSRFRGTPEPTSTGGERDHQAQSISLVNETE